MAVSFPVDDRQVDFDGGCVLLGHLATGVPAGFLRRQDNAASPSPAAPTLHPGRGQWRARRRTLALTKLRRRVVNRARAARAQRSCRARHGEPFSSARGAQRFARATRAAHALHESSGPPSRWLLVAAVRPPRSALPGDARVFQRQGNALARRYQTRRIVIRRASRRHRRAVQIDTGNAGNRLNAVHGLAERSTAQHAIAV